MKIVVCVKQVVDSIVPVKAAVPPTAIDEDDIVWVVNPYDLLAMEDALRIRERFENATITAISMGPRRVEKGLRRCLALGADEAIHILDDAIEGLDSFATATILAGAIAKLGFDLVLCGARSADAGTSNVGPCVAELLNVAQVTSVAKIALAADGKSALVERRLERGDREAIQCPLPAVLTIDVGANEPRYPTLPARKGAATAEVGVLDLRLLGLQPGQIGSDSARVKVKNISTPRPKARKIFTPDSSLSAEERIRLLMSGGVMEKKGDFLEGTASKVAAEVSEQLKKYL